MRKKYFIFYRSSPKYITAAICIVLPDVPVVPIRDIVLDEMAAAPVANGTYDRLTLKRSFDAGWNTICLPFKVKDVASLFGAEAKAYGFSGFVEGELDFVITETLEAGQPYVVYLPNTITDDIVLINVKIDEANTQAGYVHYYGSYFRGTYAPVQTVQMPKADVTSIYLLNLDGTVVKSGEEPNIKGFSAFFELPENAENVTLHPYDDPTRMEDINVNLNFNGTVYNVAGQRLSKPQKGINIVNGKKVLR